MKNWIKKYQGWILLIVMIIAIITVISSFANTILQYIITYYKMTDMSLIGIIIVSYIWLYLSIKNELIKDKTPSHIGVVFIISLFILTLIVLASAAAYTTSKEMNDFIDLYSVEGFGKILSLIYTITLIEIIFNSKTIKLLSSITPDLPEDSKWGRFCKSILRLIK